MLRWPDALILPHARIIAVLALLSASVLALPWLAGSGLVGRYYALNDRTKPPRLTAFDDDLQARLPERARRFLYHRFGVTWTGWLRVPRDGRYAFAVDAGGEWAMRVDGQPVAGEGHGARLLLRRGLVPIEVDYHRTRDARGEPHAPKLMATWGPVDGPLLPLRSPDIVPTRAAARLQPLVPEVPRFVLGWPALVVPLAWTCALLGIGTLWAMRPIARHVGSIAERDERRALAGILVAVAVATASAVWWGVPEGWAVDEIWPSAVSDGSRRLFSNGWFIWYPPLHYYVLAVVSAPLELAAWAGLADVSDRFVYGALFVIQRSVTVVMSVATAFLVYLCALEVHGRQPWAIATAALPLAMPTFVYYGKLSNVDVPYVCWLLWALLHYLRAVKHGRARDYLAFAALATLAVTTKDQAYAYFVFPIGHLVALRARHHVRAGWSGLVRLARDPVLLQAAAVALALFVVIHNLAFNFDGFVEHVNLLTGPGGTAFRAFEPTVAGQIALLGSSVAGWAWAMGWPLLLASCAGLGWIAWRTPRMGLALLLPIASYQACFIGAILYHHDRFFIATTLLLAVGGGVVVGWLLARERPAWARGTALVVFLVLAWRGYSINLLMAHDSRYAVERWLAERAGGDRLVGFAGLPEFLPRTWGLHHTDVAADWREVVKKRPDFIVINAEYSQREWPSATVRAFYERLRSGHAGYRLALAHRTPPGIALVGYSDHFTDGRENLFTNLDKVNPLIEVYERTPEGPLP